MLQEFAHLKTNFASTCILKRSCGRPPSIPRTLLIPCSSLKKKKALNIGRQCVNVHSYFEAIRFPGNHPRLHWTPNHEGRCFSTRSSMNSISAQPFEDDYVQSWVRRKNELLRMEVGSLRELNWTEASEMLARLRSHQTLGKSRQHIEDGFLIVDRLFREIERGSSEIPPRSLWQTSWRALLVGWREFVFSNIREVQSSSEKERRSRPQWRTESSLANGTLSTDAVLKRVERYITVGLVQPDPVVYAILLHVMKKVGDPRLVPYEAEKIYQIMIHRSGNDPFDKLSHPTVITMNEIIEIWAQSWLPEAPQHAERHLRSLQHWFAQTKRQDLRPQANTFCSVMDAHSRSSEPHEAFCRIWELFEEMKATCDSSSRLDRIAYNQVCHALSDCKHPKSPDACRSILDEMCDLFLNKGLGSFEPSQRLLSTVITAYGRAGRTEEAAALLEYMDHLGQETGHASIRPDVVCFSALIWAYARAGKPSEAEEVLARLLRLIEQGQSDFFLNSQILAGVLVAWAESRDRNSAEHVLGIIDRLRKIATKGKEVVEINISLYNPLLACYSRQNSVKGALQAESWFCWLEQQDSAELKPDRNSYFNVISAWCNAGNPDRAEAFLRDVCVKVQRGLISQSLLEHRYFSVVIDGWGKSNDSLAGEKANSLFQLMEGCGLRANVVTFTSLLWTWARSHTTTDPAKHVEHIFNLMKKRHEEGDILTKPNSVTYSAVICGLTRSSDSTALDRAETVLGEMKTKGVTPSNLIYELLMHAWMRRDNVARVEALFQEMREGFEAGNPNLRPRAPAFRTRLEAWSRVGHPEKAKKMLQEWISESEAGRVNEKPDVQAFNAVLTAWLRSSHADAAKNAENGLLQMFDLFNSKRFHCRPDKNSFNIVITAYANSSLPEAGLKALQLLNELKRLTSEVRKDDRWWPDAITYSQTLLALCRCGDNSVDEVIRQLLSEMKSKHESFWKDEKSQEVMEEVKASLSASSFPSKQELLAELSCVQSVISSDILSQI